MTQQLVTTVNGRKITAKIEYIDLARAKQQLRLPDPWPALEASGFHPDLVDRAYAHLAYAVAHGFEENARAVLGELGDGFVAPFDRTRFDPEEGDPNFDLKTKALNAIQEASDFYGDRISAVVWNSFAHLASRTEPEVEKSIIKEAADGTLPHHYMVVDSELHAAGLVYVFILHVNSIMFQHTGRILSHNCDCSCSLVNLEEIDGVLRFNLPRERIVPVSQSVATHFLAETVKLIENGLPFAYTITPEATEIQQLL